MNRLEVILSILDKPTRQRELISYARNLGADYHAAKDSRNEYNEEKLAILIYDAEIRSQNKKLKNIKVYAACLVIFIILIIAIIKLPKSIKYFFMDEANDSVVEKPDEKIVLYDKNGKIVKAKVMHGIYKDYDKNGNVKNIYYYRNGELVKTERFDNITHETTKKSTKDGLFKFR